MLDSKSVSVYHNVKCSELWLRSHKITRNQRSINKQINKEHYPLITVYLITLVMNNLWIHMTKLNFLS